MRITMRAALCLGCFLGLSIAAPAQRGDPGSLLLFPEYDSRTGTGLVNLITVTNSFFRLPGDTDDRDLVTDVDTSWVYVVSDTCTENDIVEPMPDADTLTVVASAHNSVAGQGYLFVYAKEPGNGAAIVHNHLIGTSTILDGVGVLDYTVEPFSFVGIGDGTLTDLNGDGIRDLDGVEYGMVADQMIVPRFFGQDSSGPESQIVLIDLTGGRFATTLVQFHAFNDNEEFFSVFHEFHCWTKTDLSSISSVFTNDFLQNWTNHDPAEVLGYPSQEAGWMRVDGVTAKNYHGTIFDPAIVCLLVEGHTGSGWRTSVHPAGLGQQDNGALLADGWGAPSGGWRR